MARTQHEIHRRRRMAPGRSQSIHQVAKAVGLSISEGLGSAEPMAAALAALLTGRGPSYEDVTER